MSRLTPYKMGTDLLLNELSSNFNKLLSAFENSPGFGLTEISSAWVPRIDIKEESNQYIVYADVPGYTKINIEVKDNVLTIEGNKESEERDENKSFLHIERKSGSFTRKITLHNPVDPNKVKAKNTNGVLEIILPKMIQNVRKIQVEKSGKSSKTMQRTQRRSRRIKVEKKRK